jgi:hypothetical protein
MILILAPHKVHFTPLSILNLHFTPQNLVTSESKVSTQNISKDKVYFMGSSVMSDTLGG